MAGQQNKVSKDFKADKGSQYQLQQYINSHESELNGPISNKLGIPIQSIEWKSPLASDSYKEFQDRQFLDALGIAEKLWPELRKFWPKGGPIWDALAIYNGKNGSSGVILVEAKSHLGEMVSTCQAKAESSISLIQESMNRTKEWLEVTTVSDWMTPYYQYSNRLAHLYFLREKGDVQAWLVNVYFLDDPTHDPGMRTDMQKWSNHLAKVSDQMGLDEIAENFKFVKEVFLPSLK